VGRAERLPAAEEALALGLPLVRLPSPRVLTGDLPERLGGTVPAHDWARQGAWERDAPPYLVALWQMAALSLACAHGDAGHRAAAMHLYATCTSDYGEKSSPSPRADDEAAVCSRRAAALASRRRRPCIAHPDAEGQWADVRELTNDSLPRRAT